MGRPGGIEMSGFQGKKNVYTCDTCGRQMVTVDRDDGVTPFATRCSCPARAHMTSSMYQVDQALPATHEWYRPAPGTLLKSIHVHEHVKRGGLLLREIGAVS
jgi:hypothetical protein